MKPIKLLLIFISVIISNAVIAQYDSIVVSSTCVDPEATGVYKYDIIFNGKPRYVKNPCDSRTTASACYEANKGPYYIRWNETAWEWTKDPAGCQWLEDFCVPNVITGAVVIIEEIYSTNTCNSTLPPCFGWNNCEPTLTSGCSCCIIDGAVLGDTSFCENGTKLISISASQSKVNYYLRDDATDEVVAGPVAGTGQAISLSTGNISATKVFNVLAANITDSANCNLELSTKVSITIKNKVITNQSVTICEGDSIKVGTKIYNVAGNYTDTLTAANTCDSIINTNLAINQVPIVTTTVNSITVTADATGANYQWINCAGNTPINGETNQSYTATANGNYAVVVTKNGCSDTSACVSIINVGISNISNLTSQISIYPNPNNGAFTMSATSQGVYNIQNELGQVIQSVILNSANNYTVNVENLSNGIYFVTGFNNETITNQKVVVVK